MRRRIGFGEAADFPIIQEMKDAGHTDYVLFVHRFAARRHDRRDGLLLLRRGRPGTPRASATANIAALRRLVPALALAIKSGALAAHRRHAGRGLSRPRCRPARARGPHPARRRRPHRGGAVVLRPAQLHHHHRHRAPGEIIPLLNDYAEAVITAIQQAGGDVLKLIGDGTLAIFRADDPALACAKRAQGRARHAPAACAS